MTPRCEPADADRERDGWHWLGVGRRILWFWDAATQRWKEVSTAGMSCDPVQVTDNWPFPGKRRYIGAVPRQTQAEVDALVKAADALLTVLPKERAPVEAQLMRRALEACTPFADPTP